MTRSIRDPANGISLMCMFAAKTSQNGSWTAELCSYAVRRLDTIGLVLLLSITFGLCDFQEVYSLLITDFAKSRGMDKDTISRYIKRNAARFADHTYFVKNKLAVDDYGQYLLNKQYPLPSSFEAKLQTELDHAQQEIIDLQDNLLQLGEDYQALSREKKKLESLLAEKDQQQLAVQSEAEANYKLAVDWYNYAITLASHTTTGDPVISEISYTQV